MFPTRNLECWLIWFVQVYRIYLHLSPSKSVKKNAVCLKLFCYKVFVHWKLTLLNLLMDSLLRQVWSVIKYMIECLLPVGKKKPVYLWRKPNLNPPESRNRHFTWTSRERSEKFFRLYKLTFTWILKSSFRLILVIIVLSITIVITTIIFNIIINTI